MIRISVIVVCFVIALCLGFLLQPAIHAHYLLTELETLRVSHSTFEDAERLARKIGAKPTGYTTCDRSYCEWHKKIGNSLIPHWWRGSGEAFQVSFAVKDSVVTSKNVGYRNRPFLSFFGELGGAGELGPHAESKLVTIGGQRNAEFPYYEVKVCMKPEASAEDRKRYSSFNFRCFWRYKGCKDARELLPALGSDVWTPIS